MPKVTLNDAIAKCEAQDLAPIWPETLVIMAAAKAFACERCKGTGFNLVPGNRLFVECPACTEFRKIAREGVEE